MKKALLLLLLFILSACVSGLTGTEKAELEEVKRIRPDIYTEEKSTIAGVMLGFIWGGGSFYTGNIGTGIVSLILFPISIFWDPINGYNGSLEANYIATRAKYKQLKENGEVKENFFNNK